MHKVKFARKNLIVSVTATNCFCSCFSVKDGYKRQRECSCLHEVRLCPPFLPSSSKVPEGNSRKTDGEGGWVV